MTRPDLDALRKLLEKANPPWTHNWRGHIQDNHEQRVVSTVLLSDNPEDDAPLTRDIDLIVAAVNALPELIAWIEELKEDNRDLADALISMLRE